MSPRPWCPDEDLVLLISMVVEYRIGPAVIALERDQADCLARFDELVGPIQDRDHRLAALRRAEEAAG